MADYGGHWVFAEGCDVGLCDLCRRYGLDLLHGMTSLLMRGKKVGFADALFRIMCKGGKDSAYKATSKGTVWVACSSRGIDTISWVYSFDRGLVPHC